MATALACCASRDALGVQDICAGQEAFGSHAREMFYGTSSSI